MDIIFANSRIKKKCLSAKGKEKLKHRLDDIHAADSLKVMMTLPGHCHPLIGNLKGKWSIDLEQPYRLIFESANEPLSVSEDGWLDITQITAVRILDIRSTHGK